MMKTAPILFQMAIFCGDICAKVTLVLSDVGNKYFAGNIVNFIVKQFWNKLSCYNAHFGERIEILKEIFLKIVLGV